MPRPAQLLLLASLALFPCACGHPATVAECEEIVVRISTLELRRIYDSEELKQRTELAKRQLRDAMLKDCVGKRITSKAMQCVRTATSSQQILDECLPFAPR
jgi:hypothetical protein